MHDAALNRGRCGLRAIIHLQLIEDALDVVLDRMFGDVRT